MHSLHRPTVSMFHVYFATAELLKMEVTLM